MGSSLLAIWWLLVPYNSSISTTTQQFLRNTWNGPSSLITTTDIHDIFFCALRQNTKHFYGRWFPLISGTRVILNSIRFSRASPKWITKWHIEIEYSRCFPAKLFRVLMPRRQPRCVTDWMRANIQSRPTRMSRWMAEHTNSQSVSGTEGPVRNDFQQFSKPSTVMLHEPHSS